MAGHNKWKQIKEKKSKTDAQKSKIFAKFARLITMEARKSGGLDSPGLKSAVSRAKSENMPNENIDRAIKKALETSTDNSEIIYYETYGPCGVAIVIEVLTDNRNRSAQEVKAVLSKHNCSLASVGSAMWAFQKNENGLYPASLSKISEEMLSDFERLMVDLENLDDVQEIFTNAE